MKFCDSILKIKKLPVVLLATFFVLLLAFSLPVNAERDIVVVIDPGHGGDNMGAMYNDFIEKYMNLIVANAMREELEKYEGIVVYLTHEDAETNLTLKQRAEFAASKNADFMFCLHFNMSESGILYGAEVWVSAFDVFYAKGHSFGQIMMQALEEMGLFNRGIKTRINNRDEDYYGIIRESRALDINTILIEYAHLDHIYDQEFYTLGDFQLEEFGRVTATAVAQFFRLNSRVLNVDFSDFPVPEVDIPTEIVRPDLTPPDVSHLELVSLDVEKREAVFKLIAEDYDSFILYYAICLDGGRNFGILQPFPRNETEVLITLDLPAERNLRVVAQAFNAYDRITPSNIISIAALPPDKIVEDILEEIEEIIEISLAELTQELTERQEQIYKRLETYQIILITIAILMILVIIIVISRITLLLKIRRQNRIVDKSSES